MSLQTSLPGVVAADANVVLSSLIGGRARLVFAATSTIRVVGADAVAAEVARHLPAIAARRGLDAQLLLAALSVAPIEWVPEPEYIANRAQAERRIAYRDPEDWPTVALALSRSIPIWSQDKDMDDSGVPTYSTGDLLDLLNADR